jgi:hypothetical protein
MATLLKVTRATPEFRDVRDAIAEVTLTLSPEEAATLLVVAEHIGGNPGNSPRGHMDAVGRAIRDAGIYTKHPIRCHAGELCERVSAGGPGLYFKNKATTEESDDDLMATVQWEDY